MKNNISDEKIGKLEKRIKILKIISAAMCFIGAILVTILINLNFMIEAIISAGVTFFIAITLDIIRKILNMMRINANKNKNKIKEMN